MSMLHLMHPFSILFVDARAWVGESSATTSCLTKKTALLGKVLGHIVHELTNCSRTSQTIFHREIWMRGAEVVAGARVVE